jgi:hypothetical protein
VPMDWVDTCVELRSRMRLSPKSASLQAKLTDIKCDGLSGDFHHWTEYGVWPRKPGAGVCRAAQRNLGSMARSKEPTREERAAEDNRAERCVCCESKGAHLQMKPRESLTVDLSSTLAGFRSPAQSGASVTSYGQCQAAASMVS